MLNGIFIVAEDQIGIGDVVDLGLATGVVEYVAIRVTHVRDVNGTLWYVRNGEITRIGNMSQGWSRVIIDLAVPVDADIRAVEKAMHDAAKSVFTDPKWRSRVIEQPEVWGLESITGDALVTVERSTRGGEFAWPEGFDPLRARRYGEATFWYGRAASTCEDAR